MPNIRSKLRSAFAYKATSFTLLYIYSGLTLIKLKLSPCLMNEALFACKSETLLYVLLTSAQDVDEWLALHSSRFALEEVAFGTYQAGRG
jgi:hypothetical protein